ncbi:conserved hypothetical protein [Microbacterium sp. 8M]|uniref:NAD(P)H-binding protein n=1 Tax=Microbacterium sp. 8M TaxID=2653153 RepID=UPI0012F0DEF1|nr:NAD(P)H-binding protein [Microbacterium sp. 8M]VXB24953.1 conserved hypothetical protein [Microbacterium sp. 8M]
MRVVVIGASGRSGGAAAGHALAAGHEVVSVVRRPASAPEGTIVATADARDVAALTTALRGADAVISAIGHVRTDGDVVVLQEGIAALLAAMGAAGVSRVVAVSAAGAYVAGDDPLSRFVAKPILERVLKANNTDTRAMDAALAASATEWTSLRPSRLIPGTGAADYRVGVDRTVRWHYSTRFDTVGRAAVDSLAREDWIRRAVYITE